MSLRPVAPTWLLPVASGIALFGGLVTELASPVDPLVADLVPQPPAIYAATGLVQAVLAALVLTRGSSRRLGIVLAACASAWTLAGLARVVARAELSSSSLTDAASGADAVLLWVVDLTASPVALTASVLLLLFPTGRFVPGAWGVASAVSLSVSTAVAVLLVLGPAPLVLAPKPTDYAPEVARLDPTTIGWLSGSGPFLAGCITLAFVNFLVPVATVVIRYRRSTGVERDRMRWLLLGALLVGLAVAVAHLFGARQISELALVAMVNVISVTMGIAVVAPRVVAVEDLLARTVVFSGVSTLLVVVDLAVVWLLTEVLESSLSQRDVVLLVLVLSAVLYAPLRSRLADVVRRLVRGERDRPYDAVATLAARLESTEDEVEQLATVAHAVASAFRISYVGMEIERSDGARLPAAHGRRPAQVRRLPIQYRDQTVGQLVLPARGVRSHLDPRSERLLGDLVRQAATFARAGRLADELQANRARLVVAREEERRRIRRDLHDELAPSLGGIVFQVESATLLVERDPEQAKALIAGTTTHLQDVVAHVRRLVHDLRPPVLDDRGLAGALRQLAEATMSTHDVDVTIEHDDVDALPAAVEVAAFRIAEEALANVVAHARAATCSVSLAAVGRSLRIEVVDDGVGIPPEVEAGAGLITLRERAAELGGSLEVTCPPDGGTVVRATLPLRSRT